MRVDARKPEVPALGRDWQAICQIEDPHLKRAISATSDPRTLAGFARGFPHLFTSAYAAAPFVPLSALQAAIAEDPEYPERVERDQVVHLGQVTKRFGIPSIFDWHDEGVPIPSGVREQLHGKPLAAPLLVEYDGLELVVTSLMLSDEESVPGEPIDGESIMVIGAALKRFIDVDG